VKRLRESKAEVVRALALTEDEATGVDDDPASWRRPHYIDRTIDRGLSGYRPERQARSLAFQDLMDKWHKLYGRRWPVWQCAGCDEPIGGLSALTLADDNRVHFDTERECLIRYGERWRREAEAGLQALGLDPPPETEP
jgi:hypothetical protein